MGPPKTMSHTLQFSPLFLFFLENGYKVRLIFYCIIYCSIILNFYQKKFDQKISIEIRIIKTKVCAIFMWTSHLCNERLFPCCWLWNFTVAIIAQSLQWKITGAPLPVSSTGLLTLLILYIRLFLYYCCCVYRLSIF